MTKCAYVISNDEKQKEEKKYIFQQITKKIKINNEMDK